jgi:hypothetical protein
MTRITFAAAGMIAVLALLFAASTDHRNTVFSLDVSDAIPVVRLAPGQTLCQGPLRARGSFSSMQIWASAGKLSLAVRGRTVISRQVVVPRTPTGLVTIPIGAGRVRDGARFSVCLRNTGAAQLSIEGGPRSRYSGALTVAGHANPDAVAMTFGRSDGPSLLSLLPAVFERASLFKLSWVGAWTFWLLCAGVLGTMVLAWVALAGALCEDADGARCD